MFDLTQDGDLLIVTMKGDVTADEVTAFYQRLTPIIEAADRVGLVIDMTGFNDMSAEAIRRDIPYELGLLDQLRKMPRAAVLTDKQFVGVLFSAINPLIPVTDIRVFGPDEMQAARRFAGTFPRQTATGRGARLIDSPDPGVLAFEIDGYIDDDQMEPITAAVNARIERGESFSALARIKAFGGFDPDILTEASFFKMKFGALGALKKYALVSDERWLGPLVGFARGMTGIEMRLFPLVEEQAAWDWLKA